MSDEYRFECGALYRLEVSNGVEFYLFCYIRSGCNTKAQAIREYEALSDERMLDELYPE